MEIIFNPSLFLFLFGEFYCRQILLIYLRHSLDLLWVVLEWMELDLERVAAVLLPRVKIYGKSVADWNDLTLTIFIRIHVCTYNKKDFVISILR